MGKSILICDDAAFMRMMLKDILVKEGYDVVGEAVNGAEGVDKYNSLKPDLVTMDITMPEMDGIAALNMKLPSGVYIITSSYDGLNVANTVTITS